MKKLPKPYFDDEKALENISERLKNAGDLSLSPYITDITAAYKLYVSRRGNISNFKEVNLSDQAKKKLGNLYKNPSKEIVIIKKMRKEASPDVCPMCGGYGNGTLEHVFPKSQFKEFAVFTKNLVPACNCNNLRGIKSKGTKLGERILHPYYDNLMSKRLLRASFKGTFPTPEIGLEICYSGRGVRAVQFHLNEVIKKTNIYTYLENYWAKIHRKPNTMIRELPRTTLTAISLKERLKATLEYKDDEYETPNNWDSMMFAGILASDDAQAHLLAYLNNIITEAINPEDF